MTNKNTFISKDYKEVKERLDYIHPIKDALTSQSSRANEKRSYSIDESQLSPIKSNSNDRNILLKSIPKERNSEIKKELINDFYELIDCTYSLYNQQDNNWIQQYESFITDNEAIVWNPEINSYKAKNKIGNIILGKYKFWVLSIAFKILSTKEFSLSNLLNISKIAKCYNLDNIYKFEEDLIFLIKTHFSEEVVVENYLKIPNTSKVDTLDHDNYQTLISFYTNSETEDRSRLIHDSLDYSKIRPFNSKVRSIKQGNDSSSDDLNLFVKTEKTIKNKTAKDIFNQIKKQDNILDNGFKTNFLKYDTTELKHRPKKIIRSSVLNNKEDKLSREDATYHPMKIRQSFPKNKRKEQEEYDLSYNNNIKNMFKNREKLESQIKNEDGIIPSKSEELAKKDKGKKDSIKK